MLSPPPPKPQLELRLVQPFSDELFAELSASVKGPVLRPTDAEYSARSKTFNGKLKPQAKALVSPLDAHDVSAVVKFCVKHNFSPSVRAGGYGIAGWAVAGDVIIDMSMMTDIDIEPPKALADGHAGPDWIALADMPPPGSKGKGRAHKTLADSHTQAPPASAGFPLGTSPQHRSGKRRREDRSPSPSAGAGTAPDEHSPSAGAEGPYDGASRTVASFLRGPPLPPEPGETPRQPPTNRQRLHSPPAEALDAYTPPPPEPENGTHTKGGDDGDERLEMPPLGENTRQLSGESTSSSSSRQSDAFAFSSHHSSSSGTTAGAASPDGDEDRRDSAVLPPVHSARSEPFAYLSSSSSSSFSGAAPSARLPMYSAPGPNPVLPMAGASLPLPPLGAGVSAIPNWPMPPATHVHGGTSAWGPGGPAFGSGSGIGVGVGMRLPLPQGPPAAASPFALPPPLGFGQLGQSLFGGGGPDGARGVQHARPVHTHAYVTFGAGMRQKDVDVFSAENPLEGTNAVTGEREDAVVPYHVPMSAHPVGSSIMLLAGFGFISRMHGLSIDNLVEVEMVLADGRIVVVNSESDPELWWAVRGAGPAFGIATRYKARAFPVPVVFAGNLVYRFHRATAPSLIKHFRDCIKHAPRELYANVLLTAGPADKDSLVVIQMCYVGPRAQGLEYLQAISSWDGERCLLNEVNEKSFLNQQDSVAQVLRGRAGRQWFLRSALITSLPDEVINRTVIEFADTPIGCTWLFELAGGAIGDFEDTCLPKTQRDATWTVAALHQWDMGVDDPRCITTAEQVSPPSSTSTSRPTAPCLHAGSPPPPHWMAGTIQQVAVGGPYPTFLGRHEPAARTMACYGANWDRLAALKRRYDPHGLFRNNFWPLDRHGRPLEVPANEPPSP
ncbi:hypothetical protein BD413DRAFT_472171 [Trametes elegans]|nr:hypothetical protein BD413DRAFT_472171 [Trametes elegans]